MKLQIRLALTHWRVWMVLAWLVAAAFAGAHTSMAAPVAGITLPDQIERIDAHDKLYMLVDPDNSLELDAIRKRDADFVPVKRTLFPRRSDTVWTRLMIHNPHGSEREVLLMNPSPFVDFIDLHLVHANGATETYYRGTQRLHEPGRMPHRDHVQPVRLAAGETVAVYVRHRSLHAMEINLWLYSMQSFLLHVSIDALIWGTFVGLLLTAMLYNTIAGILLHYRAFLYYVLYAGSLLLFTATMQGDAVMAVLQAVLPMDWGRVTPTNWENLSRILVTVAIFNWILFTISYFELPRYAPRLYYLLQTWKVVALAVGCAVVASMMWPIRDTVAAVILYLVPLFLLASVIVAVLATKCRYPGWPYFVMGVGSFTLFALAQDVAWFGFDLGIPPVVVTYGTPIGVLIELGSLALGLSARIQQLRNERDHNERLLLLQSKFLSVGKMVSSVIHQLKRPVIHAGNQLMKIEALLDRSVEEREADLPKAVVDMRCTIDFMDKAVIDMYRFYVEEKQPSPYRPAAQIELVLGMLQSAISEKAIRVHCALQPELQLYGYGGAFANTMMILLENAVLVLDERAVVSPTVQIQMLTEDQELIVFIDDNAGGIQEAPLESVFNPYVSNHRHESLGIGLALAKQLVEEKLGGHIEVRNLRAGAQFTLRLPMQAPPA